MKDKESLVKITMALIDGRNYMVEPFPEKAFTEGPSALKKSVAYRWKTSISDKIYPYRGIVTDEFNRNESPPGLWFKKRHGKWELIVLPPRNKAEKKLYSSSVAQDLSAMMLNQSFAADDFLELGKAEEAYAGNDAYLPPIHEDDDPMCLLMKLAIRLKGAPLKPYSKRLASLAADTSSSKEATTIVGNVKRRHKFDRRMSSSMFQRDGDVWQFETAILLKDAPNSMHPMNIPEGSILAVFPSGQPFDISDCNIIDARKLAAKAIAESPEPVSYLDIKKKKE